MKTVSSIALLLAMVWSAQAQEGPQQKPVCFARAAITSQMMSASASPVVVAEMDAATLYEIWSGPKGWTAFMTDREGMMCPVANGVGPVHTAERICIDPARCPRI